MSPNLILKTQAKSLQLGRRLYQYQVDQDFFWLKTHVVLDQSESHLGFLRELSFYQQIDVKLQNICLPAKILNLETIFPHYEFAEQTLCLPHHQFLFKPISQLDIVQIKQIVFSAMCALQQLFDAGWVHGDLKPQHFLTDLSRVYLIDFEYSFQLKNNPPLMLNATPRYMAPELFNGAAKSIRSDLYALGIILYEWLSQKKLQAKDYHQWAILHCQKLKIELPESYRCFEPLLTQLLFKHAENRTIDFDQLKANLNS